ncbi:MAG TPA: MCE family protein [Streptosporangiaceae bacterium]|nr:MCE family protein [Streptosporangiaceae bacterium]
MTTKLRTRLSGVAFLVVMVLLAWLAIGLYNKQFTPVSTVTLYTDSVGNEMHVGSEVMVRGVQVGEVRSVSAHGSGARLELAIQPGAVSELPANVTAQMMPTTLFGQRFVDLVLPAQPTAARLTSGSVITQDHSADAIELERVLNNLLPMLNAVEPDKLSVTLTAIAQGLQGRGTELGHTLVTLNAYLHTMNPQLPAIDTDIRELAGLTHTYHQAAPQIIQALNDLTTTNETIANQQANLAALFSNVTAASDQLHTFLDNNSANAINLSTDSVATLGILARYSPEFPCTLHALAKFVPAMDRALGKGTKQPGLHVNVTVVPSYASARYIAGVDTPIYGDDLGPHCYPVPFPGIHLNDGVGGGAAGASAVPSSGGVKAGGKPAHGRRHTTQPAIHTTADQQSELARELAALDLNQSPASLPDWTSLLVGPVFQGQRVVLGVSKA